MGRETFSEVFRGLTGETSRFSSSRSRLANLGTGIVVSG